MRAGPNHHTLPAVYLAGFSNALQRRARESLLWVGRRGVTTVFQKKAEGVAVVKDIYTLKKGILVSNQEWSPDNLDVMWRSVEGRLSWAIEAIINSGEYFDAEMWLNVLAEFAAQIFVRGFDFGERFVQRFPAELRRGLQVNVADSDHINGARLIELHRLRGATRRANWTIFHAGRAQLITNDLCRTPVFDSNGRMGYVIPLRFDAALALTFSVGHHQSMTLQPHPEDRWVIGPIGHETLDEARIAKLNEMLAESAVKEIYGAPEGVVGELHARMSSESPPNEIVEPTLFGPFRDMGDSREFEQLVPRVATPPSQYFGAQEAKPSS